MKRKRFSISKADNLIQAEDDGTSSNQENKRKVKEKRKPVLHEEDETESRNNKDPDSFNEKTDIPNVSKLGELQLTLIFFHYIEWKISCTGDVLAPCMEVLLHEN